MMIQISVYIVVNQIVTRLHYRSHHISTILNASFGQAICAISSVNENDYSPLLAAGSSHLLSSPQPICFAINLEARLSQNHQAYEVTAKYQIV